MKRSFTENTMSAVQSLVDGDIGFEEFEKALKMRITDIRDGPLSKRCRHRETDDDSSGDDDTDDEPADLPSFDDCDMDRISPDTLDEISLETLEKLTCHVKQRQHSRRRNSSTSNGPQAIRPSIKGQLRREVRSIRKQVRRQGRRLNQNYHEAVGLSNVAVAKGDTKSAAKICLEIIRKAPNAPEPILLLATIYDQKDKREKAFELRFMATYLINTVNEWMVMFDRSIETGKIDVASLCISRAVNCDPNNIDLHIKKLEFIQDFEMPGRRLGAMQKLLTTIHLNPAARCRETGHLLNAYMELYVSVLKELTKRYMDMGDYESATKQLRKSYGLLDDDMHRTEINRMLQIQMHMSHYKDILLLLLNKRQIGFVNANGKYIRREDNRKLGYRHVKDFTGYSLKISKPLEFYHEKILLLASANLGLFDMFKEQIYDYINRNIGNTTTTGVDLEEDYRRANDLEVIPYQHYTAANIMQSTCEDEEANEIGVSLSKRDDRGREKPGYSTGIVKPVLRLCCRTQSVVTILDIAECWFRNQHNIEQVGVVLYRLSVALSKGCDKYWSIPLQIQCQFWQLLARVLVDVGEKLMADDLSDTHFEAVWNSSFPVYFSDIFVNYTKRRSKIHAAEQCFRAAVLSYQRLLFLDHNRRSDEMAMESLICYLSKSNAAPKVTLSDTACIGTVDKFVAGVEAQSCEKCQSSTTLQYIHRRGGKSLNQVYTANLIVQIEECMNLTERVKFEPQIANEFAEKAKSMLFGNFFQTLKPTSFMDFLRNRGRCNRDRIYLQYLQSYHDNGVVLKAYTHLSQHMKDMAMNVYVQLCNLYITREDYEGLQNICLIGDVIPLVFSQPAWRKQFNFMLFIASILCRDGRTATSIFKPFFLERSTSIHAMNLLSLCGTVRSNLALHKFIGRLIPRTTGELRHGISLLRANLYTVSYSYVRALRLYAEGYEREPLNPYYSMMIGITYVGMSLQRRIKRRNQLMRQALMFLEQYRNLRGNCQEVYYNIGRAFHQLGLLSGAIRCYETVLKLPCMVPDHEILFDLRRYAAFNMALIYRDRPNATLTDDIMRRYLTI